MDILGTVPQWITAIVAIGALCIAYNSIKSQREIARKRAAMDFFIKTETDDDTLSAHDKFNEAAELFRTHLNSGKTCEEFVSTQGYLDIRAYLNLHELMAVGINQKVFDNDVCYDFWSGELDKACERTQELIVYIQSRPDEPGTYCELVKVSQDWEKRWKEAASGRVWPGQARP